MDDVLKGFVAGFVATAILSILMVIKTQAGIATGFSVIDVLSAVVERPGEPAFGWVAHFAVGVLLWGGLFAIASDLVPGTYLIKGVIFGVAAWLLMMLVFFPYAGHQLFGTDLGGIVPVATLVLHVVFGVVLGLTYQALGGTTRTVEKLT